jgi:nicotinamide mononucleotide adenylyltransferase
MTRKRLEQLVKSVRVWASSVASISRVPWVSWVPRVTRVTDVSEVAEVLVDDLIVNQLTNVLAAQTVNMGAASDLADRPSVQGVNVSAVDESDGSTSC